MAEGCAPGHEVELRCSSKSPMNTNSFRESYSESHSFSIVPKIHKLSVEMEGGSQLGNIKKSHKNVLSVLTCYLLTYTCSVLATLRDKGISLSLQTTEKLVWPRMVHFVQILMPLLLDNRFYRNGQLQQASYLFIRLFACFWRSSRAIKIQLQSFLFLPLVFLGFTEFLLSPKSLGSDECAWILHTFILNHTNDDLLFLI